MGSHPRLETFRMQNEVDRLFIGFWFNPQAGLWRFPLETVSQSEAGFERSYQGSVILAHWKFYLPERGVEKISLTLEAGSL